MNLASAKVDKRIPKNRFNFEIPQLESLVWLYKISKDTTGINDSEEFKEYQIFEIIFKDKIAKETIIKIQTAIPYPILFHVKCGKQSFFAFAYGKLYLETDNELLSGEILNLTASSVERLTFGTIETIAEIQSKEQENLETFIDRIRQIKVIEQEIALLERQRNNERQPNKRIELNEKLESLKAKIR